MVSGRSVRLDTIIWPGGDLAVAAVSSRARTVFRVVTALAPPFVMESELDEDGQCLRGKNESCLNAVIENLEVAIKNRLGRNPVRRASESCNEINLGPRPD